MRGLFLGGAVVLTALAGCSGGSDTGADQPPKPRPAKLVEVEAATNQRDLSFPAVIRAAQSAELTFQVAGEIRENYLVIILCVGAPNWCVSHT